jgi:hypothetical protein
MILSVDRSIRPGATVVSAERASAVLRAFPFHNGQCAATLPSALEAVGAMNTPIFAFLDNWGGPDIPLDVARAIAKVPFSEVFVTFGTRSWRLCIVPLKQRPPLETSWSAAL